MKRCIYKLGNKAGLYLPRINCERALTYKEVEVISDKLGYSNVLVLIEHTEEIEAVVAGRVLDKLTSKGVEVYVYSKGLTLNELHSIQQYATYISDSSSDIIQHINTFCLSSTEPVISSPRVEETVGQCTETGSIEMHSETEPNSEVDEAAIQESHDSPELIQGEQEQSKPIQEIHEVVKEIQVVDPRLQEAITKQEGIIRSLRDELESVKSSLQVALTEKTGIVAELQHKEQELHLWVSKYSELEQSRGQTQAQERLELDRKQDEIARLCFELEAKKRELKDQTEIAGRASFKLSSLTAEKSSLQDKLNELEKTHKRAVYKYDTLAEKYEKQGNALKQSKDSVLKLQSQIKGLQSSLDAVNEHNTGLISELDVCKVEITALQQSLTDTKNQAETAVQERTKELQERNIELESRESTRRALENECKQLKESKEKLQKNYESLTVKSVKQDNDLKAVTRELGNVQAANKGLTDQLSKELEEKKALETRVSDLYQKLQAQTEQVREVSKIQTGASRLQCENTSLKESLAYFKQIAGQVGNKVCKYTGRAKLISVIGTGSYGVSNISMSIAKSLSMGKVLIMDLDFDSPKLDKYTQKQPMLEDTGLTEVMQRTGMGVVLAKGIASKIEPTQEILECLIKRVEERQVKTIDYFSGLYAPELLPKLMPTDMGQLLTAFASMYDYIIVDLGKLGMSNSISDLTAVSILKASTTPIVVTQNEVSDVRGMCLKLAHYGIHKDRVYWVLNRSLTTAVNPSVSKMLGKAKQGVITFDTGVSGNKTLDRVSTPSGQLGNILDELSENNQL